MRDGSIKEAKERVNILRRSRVVAQQVSPEPQRSRKAPSMEAFRKTIKVKGRSMSSEIVEGRREERH